jgi:hypothetical protein
MWTLDSSWRNLAVGCKRAVQLEAALRERWSAPIRQAEQRASSRARDAQAAERAAREREWATERAECEQRNVDARARHAERRGDWQARSAVAGRRFAEERSAWQARETARRSAFDQLWREWSAEHSVARRRLWSRASIVLPTWLAITLASLLLVPSSPLHLGILLLAAVGAGLAMSVPARRMLTHRAQQPVYPADDPEPVWEFEAEPVYRGDEAPPSPPQPVPAPALDRRGAVSLDLTGRWWQEVHAGEGPPSQGHAHGDEGVSQFLDALGAVLSDDYFAVRDLLVRRSLDVDVLVVGPSGLWVFEVKHWSGRIVCRNGVWHRERTYYEPGGFEATEVKDINAFDSQWQREVEAIATTLSRRLKAPAADAASARGGLVFSHDEVSWEIDRSCGAGYGPPGFWVGTVAREPAWPGFDQHDQLRVLDALFTWSRKLAGDEHSRCAERLANALHEKIDIAAKDYIRRLDAT